MDALNSYLRSCHCEEEAQRSENRIGGHGYTELPFASQHPTSISENELLPLPHGEKRLHNIGCHIAHLARGACRPQNLFF